ncbi:hypothetical protein [Caballeronia sp. dw_276]|uniref:hypothetical protein n=1 Tax=Caballeronia sp. dw_276 TaxID=2719795 RepID=UPI001BD410E7|nr:hypothetical protein [Caballeronia sp. dw_276]
MGTGHLFTRRELYERVWAEPISALAKTLQVSDVWLAKTCRLSNIPLPPRGYWARLYAGQVVGKTPLPLRAPGESDQVTVGGGRYPHHRGADSKPPTVPEPPAYEETEDQIAARIEKMVPKGWRPARSLDLPYPAIARLLSEDQERQTARDRSPRSTYDAPRFESRVEQRRLLLISNLFGLLFQMEAQPSIRGNDARETQAHVGNQWVRFTVDTTAKLRLRRQQSKAPGRLAEPLAIEIKVSRWEDNDADEVLFWSDDDAGKLEAKIREIAIAIVLTGERQHRKSRQHSYEWALSSYEEACEVVRKRREDAERRERERIEQAEADRVSRLFAQVAARQQAQQIRAYVQEVITSPHAAERRAFDGERDAWACWALTVADRLDPLAPDSTPDSVSVPPLPAGFAGRTDSRAPDIPDHRPQAS